ncbi:MAG: hypothetical protein ACFE89_11220 [Candidatus Hodarchaeota archaeon]
MILNWSDSFTVVLLLTFLVEILVGRHIFKKIRRRNQQPQQQILLVLHASQAQQNSFQSAVHETPQPVTAPAIYEYHIPNPPSTPRDASWTNIALATCIISVFLVSFVLIIWTLRPFTYSGALRFLTVLLPLPFLPLPALFRLKTLSTFGCLLIGFGLSLLLFLML